MEGNLAFIQYVSKFLYKYTGPDVVFQHAGDWTIEEYAKSAVYPRGSVVGQVCVCFAGQKARR